MVDELNLNDNTIVEELIQKKRSSNRLLEESKRKAEAEKETLRRIKQKKGLALTEDANPPLKEFVSQVKNETNKTGEPSELLWQPISIDKIVSLYPQKTAISDVNSVISAANQQPGVPFPLVGPGDHRGEMFVKSDEAGNFFMAQGNKNPKVFVNPSGEGQNLSTVASVPTTSSFQKPQINTGDLHHVVACMAEDIKKLRYEIETLKENKAPIIEAAAPVDRRLLIEKKISLAQQMEGMDDKSKDVIQKLLGAAQQLRSGVSHIADTTVTPTSSVLTEETVVSPKATKVSTAKLHEMLLKTTKKLNTHKTVALESLADNISNLIAESLLTNEISSPTYLKETIETYKKLVG